MGFGEGNSPLGGSSGLEFPENPGLEKPLGMLQWDQDEGGAFPDSRAWIPFWHLGFAQIPFFSPQIPQPKILGVFLSEKFWSVMIPE